MSTYFFLQCIVNGAHGDSPLGGGGICTLNITVLRLSQT
jgi:hypothetical protein